MLKSFYARIFYADKDLLSATGNIQFLTYRAKLFISVRHPEGTRECLMHSYSIAQFFGFLCYRFLRIGVYSIVKLVRVQSWGPGGREGHAPMGRTALNPSYPSPKGTGSHGIFL